MNLNVGRRMRSWASSFSFALILVACSPTSMERLQPFNVHMPDVTPSMNDEYLCTAKRITHDHAYIVHFEPWANSSQVHHLLLFGCSAIYSEDHLFPGSWNCAHGKLCKDMAIMFAWARMAPAAVLPKDVGFHVSQHAAVRYLVLQIHYSKPLPGGERDSSGVQLHMTTTPQKYAAGIYLLMSSKAVIPPHRPKFHVDVNCAVEENKAIPFYPFAYRVHTHSLGVVVTGYRYRPSTNTWTFLAKGNPQWPQAFYPTENITSIQPGDVLAARCTYNSTMRHNVTLIGSTTSDEMCNLYLMYYTSATHGRPYRYCTDIQNKSLPASLPSGNDAPVDPTWHVPEGKSISVSKKGHSDTSIFVETPTIGRHFQTTQQEDTSFFRYGAVPHWPDASLKFGQVAGVDVDADGNVVVFHRGSHVWNAMTFNPQNEYLLINQGPIAVPPVVALNASTGRKVYEWGSSLFYMPHGLTIDRMGFLWLTDVAMHQVFKYPLRGSSQPLLTLGERFVPGSDQTHFCKPTSVAIGWNGDIYVADGYCNSRVIKFSASGQFLLQWGQMTPIGMYPPPPGTFMIPHKIVMLEEKGLVCVSDRENGRLQCFLLPNGEFGFEIARDEFGGRLFSIAYSKNKGGTLYAVSGPDIYQRERDVLGFVFNASSRHLLATFAPPTGSFSQPHDIAVAKNLDDVYVVEIGPNLVWKFTRESVQQSAALSDSAASPSAVPSSTAAPADGTPKKPLDSHVLPPVVDHVNGTTLTANVTKSIDEESSNFGTSVVILALLALPILAFVLTTIIIRLQKRGKLHPCLMGQVKGWLGGYKTPAAQDKFNLGRLLNPHKGFDQVALEESDIDGEGSSGSDVEEFSVAPRKA